MSYSGPTIDPGASTDPGPPVVIHQLSHPGRNGPPLWLGLVVMLLGPIACTAGAVAVMFTSMDFDSVMTPVRNPTSVTTQEGMTYLVASQEPGRRPCFTQTTGGPREPLEPMATESLETGQGTFYSRGGFTADGVAIVQVRCPGAGSQLVVFGMAAKSMMVKMVILFGLAGLSFIGGLLMVIFRRREPRF
jgi:hypothetical protein